MFKRKIGNKCSKKRVIERRGARPATEETRHTDINYVYGGRLSIMIEPDENEGLLPPGFSLPGVLVAEGKDGTPSSLRRRVTTTLCTAAPAFKALGALLLLGLFCVAKVEHQRTGNDDGSAHGFSDDGYARSERRRAPRASALGDPAGSYWRLNGLVVDLTSRLFIPFMKMWCIGIQSLINFVCLLETRSIQSIKSGVMIIFI